ncbi:MAG: ATP-binding protein [Gemmataceae bacterium]|nr:ATP-binding protein [Gemmataceae bacterium]
MAKLKPWYQVVTPREDLRDNRPLDASEFAVHLDHIRTGRGTVSKDYTDPARFFERTFMTGSLQELASQVLRRLNGIQVETSAVFNMATQFGGGKTHALTTLFHLANHAEAAKDWKGVGSLLTKGQVSTVPKADVAVFVGTEFDAITGRKGEGEPTRMTPWGEIAWQLGGEPLFAKVAKHDAQGVAPAGDVIREMLPVGPTLILMDELMNYIARARKLGLRDQFYTFFQNLGEEARARNNLVVCVSLPQSIQSEMTPEDESDFVSLKKSCDRIGKPILMSADKEMSEIIRRRLFEWDTLSNDAKATVSAYAEWAADHAQELAGVDRDAIHEQFKACYPFHPSVISVFERKWQSLPRFQRTRGILRLLALWVAHNYQDEHRRNTNEPLITLGLAPLDNPMFRSALFEQLGSSELEIPVTTDVAGRVNESHSLKLDREASEAIKKSQLHRKVATTIFFESNGGQSQSRAEASLPEIKTDVCGPDINTADVDTVLEGLAGTCFYLQWERNRYRFGLAPNLNQVLVSRRGGVQGKAIEERICEQTEKVFRKNGTDACKFIEREFFPKRSNDVKEVPRITLVAMGIEHPAEDRTTLELMNSIVRDAGTSGRTFKSALLFAAADPAENVRDRAREVLAWEDVDDDEETKKRIDEAQFKLLARNLANARRDLDEAIFRAYKHLYLLGKDNKLRHIDLGNITSSAAGCLVEVYLQRLGSNGGLDEVVDSVPARKLPNYWPASMTEWSTKGVRNAFYSSPLLPRLINPDMIKRAIADGVSQGIIGYATKDASGRLKLEKLKEGLFDGDVEISDDVYILKGDEALKLKEPPRLAQLVVRPEHEVVKIGDQVSYTCSGLDQYGQSIGVGDVTWSATGGTITSPGLFTAGDHGGAFIVKALAGDAEALAELRVTSKDEPEPLPPPTGQQMLRWRGSVPTQKWMNFYTKVLSKLANTPGLKLEVSFEVPLDREQAPAKAAETRSGLKELGLEEGATLS